MAHQGILAWATSIRVAMASDPGRSVFQDQIQTHGFVFLDDYLDNIISVPKQDLIIELVKTPGRKKAKNMALTAMSQLRNTVPLSPEGDKALEKDNMAINSFYKALLQAKDKPGSGPTTMPHPSTDRPGQVQPDRIPRNGMGLGQRPSQDVPPEEPHREPTHVLFSQTTPNSEQADLWVIEEADETAERSHMSFRNDVVSRYSSTTAMKPLTTLMECDTGQNVNEDTMSSKSPLPEPPSNGGGDSAIAPRCTPETQTENHTVPLPERILEKPPIHENDMMTAPLPSAKHSTLLEVPLRDTPPSPKLARKPNSSIFPSLPAPFPLRKSMRAPREPSTGMCPSGTTPGVNIGGKRSSWLIKAREAKALEGTGKVTDMQVTRRSGSVTSAISAGELKRKSNEITGNGSEDERRYKAAKLVGGDVAGDVGTSKEMESGVRQRTTSSRPPKHTSPQLYPPNDQVTPVYDQQGGMLDRLKKTVEGLGARVGKSMGKSLGAAAATTWLADARAAAEAKVAERETEVAAQGIIQPLANAASDPSFEQPREHARLSLSDLLTSDEAKIQTTREPPMLFLPPTSHAEMFTAKNVQATGNSTSTTPPNSPPPTGAAAFEFPPVPVFTRPTPVFIPPSPGSTRDRSFRSRVAKTRLQPERSPPFHFIPPPPKVVSSGQSSLESAAPDRLFDAREYASAWQPATQDTEYPSNHESDHFQQATNFNDDDDDSWPFDEGGPLWTFGMVDDSMTWSTDLSAGQRADTGPVDDTGNRDPEVSSKQESSYAIVDEPDDGEHGETGNVGAAEPKMQLKNGSQLSVGSSASSNAGLLGHASKVVSSLLGASKKGKTEVKSLQLAAVAAKKQQEEMDKKAVRLKEMENRRQLAQQRKANEEKSRAMEQERRIKEEGERRKREREEHTDKRMFKGATKKEEEANKKRKVVVEVEKKTEAKKVVSKIAKPINASGASRTGPAMKSALGIKQPTALTSSAAYNASQPTAPSMPKATAKGKAKATALVPDDEIMDPSQMVQAQMTARVKVQLQAAKGSPVPAELKSENIELPDISSEYSDSEDENRVRTFDPPEWAQSPELRQALQMQSTMNPDDIFGAVRPIRMEEIFRTRTSRFRSRTSSANWAGTDGLTADEEKEYVVRMGFH